MKHVNALSETTKISIKHRFKSVFYMVALAIGLVIFGSLADARHANGTYGIASNGYEGIAWYLPRYGNFIFAILFVAITIPLVWFISVEINNCFFKSSKKTTMQIFFPIFFPLPVTLVFILYIVYWSQNQTINWWVGFGFFTSIFIFSIFLISFFYLMAKKYLLSRQNSVLLIITCCFVMLFYISLYYLTYVRSVLTTLIIILICVFSDSGGWLFGVFFGKHKMTPKLSPKKTWEGLSGSYVCSFIIIISLIILYHYIGKDSVGNILGNQYNIEKNTLITPYTKPFWWVLFLVILAVLITLSVLGDLYFSLLKRKNNIKDFSNLIKGHGGILDRIDSWIIVLSFFAILTIIISGISSLCDGFNGVDRVFNVCYVAK